MRSDLTASGPDTPPAAPAAVGDVLIPGSGPGPTIGAHDEDVELVGIARHGGDSAARRSHSTGDVPPTAPLRVVHVLVPGGRVDSAVGAHEEDVELVGIA